MKRVLVLVLLLMCSGCARYVHIRRMANGTFERTVINAFLDLKSIDNLSTTLKDGTYSRTMKLGGQRTGLTDEDR
jgi:hypothetical protein